MQLNDSFWKIAAVFALLLVALGIVGSGDLDEAERQEAQYCSMVESGHCPDYNGNYKELCRQPRK
jgi:hypothetical protein